MGTHASLFTPGLTAASGEATGVSPRAGRTTGVRREGEAPGPGVSRGGAYGAQHCTKTGGTPQPE